MKQLTFSQPKFTKREYTIADTGKIIGTLSQTSGRANTTFNDRTIEVVKPSLLSPRLDIRAPGGKPFANYQSEKVDGFWKRLFCDRAGVIRLDGQTYRFKRIKNGLTATESIWSKIDTPDQPLVHYRHPTLKWSFGEEGTISLNSDLPADAANVLVPLGLHIMLLRDRDDTAAAASSGTVVVTGG